MATEQASASIQVGFVGLGAMGSAMAPCLARFLSTKGQVLYVYNRDPSKTESLLSGPESANFRAASGLEDIAKNCNVIFTMLAHDAAVKDVMGKVVEFLKSANAADDGHQQQPRVFVDCSTVSPDTTREMSAAAEAAGALYIACPVLGRPDAAAAAKLLLFCAGPSAAKEVAMPYISSLGRKVLDLSDEAPKANIMKLLANFHLVSLIELLAEGMTLAEKNGISRDLYSSFISEMLPAPIVTGYCGRMAADAFQAGQGFTVTLGLKDVNLMRQLAERSEAPLPLADVAFNHLLAAKAGGLADKDWSALALAVREAAGMKQQ
ncbi:hypothetical protein Agub_g883 [Astrephomene gubernaculifera]|uniref:Uncharacterized protein n=1 Tax=Astrephomene gubernaculifera TaxID=47775 RepID=A0AAD3HH29_9CHLO|nr:hypothetical protein Agub_g883 [Astrephomene gubernaculifera]